MIDKYPAAESVSAPYDWDAHEESLTDTRWKKCPQCNGLHGEGCWIKTGSVR
jgi:hypothetical protein